MMLENMNLKLVFISHRSIEIKLARLVVWIILLQMKSTVVTNSVSWFTIYAVLRVWSIGPVWNCLAGGCTNKLT